MKAKKEIIKKLEKYRMNQESRGQSQGEYFYYKLINFYESKRKESYEKYKQNSGDKSEVGVYHKDSNGEYVHMPDELGGQSLLELIEHWGYEVGAIDALLWTIKDKPRYYFIPDASDKYEKEFETEDSEIQDDEIWDNE
ncbi:MAG: hypothetical protein AAB446_02065 [Patescibacteria group bacterium]